jgi:flagellar biosynthetic protein FliR
VGLGIIISIIVAPSPAGGYSDLLGECGMGGPAAGDDWRRRWLYHAARLCRGAYRGELIGLQMGLSFATFVDPGSHLNMPVLARIIDLLAMLLFLSFNGHLWLISMLVDTFHTLPIGENPVNSNAFLALTRAAGLIFLNGLMLALPIITLLLTVNLALGLLNRMAPQLSVFVIGFPLTLTVGILLMSLLMPLIAPFCEHLFGEIFNLLADIVSELPRK